MTPPTAALELVGVTKRFAGTIALDDARFALRPGTIHALLGENGAGKSTLMRAAYGLLEPDAGTILVDGAPVRLDSPADAIARGIGMVQQHFALVGAMSVAENVALGGRGRYSAREVAEQVRDIGRRTGLVLDPAARVDGLGVGAQQRLEIVKALARDARILVLDEPTAVLAPAESEDLLRWLRAFADGGGSVVLITHRLREALAAADDVTVLRRGRTVLAAGRATDLVERDLAAVMLGEVAAVDGDDTRPMPSASPQLTASTGSIVARSSALTVRDSRKSDRLRDVTLELRAGTITGVAAVEGAGQHELLRAFAGRLAALGDVVVSGTVQLPASIGFVPEDRHRDAVLLDFPLHENVALRDVEARRGRMYWDTERARTATLLAQHDVRAEGATVPVRTLSGGNQQKLVLARELDGAPALLVVENPTRGLDIRAAAAVRERLRSARDAGAAVLLHSSDLDEVLALADRVVVLYAGALREVHPPDRARVGAAMLGLD